MDQSKTPRKRVANFTADEKALLAQLIKKHPIVESKLTDGKSVIRKKTAWELITVAFNSNAHVHKRDTITLKRAWDNMKAFTRKARAVERGSLLRTGGGPSFPPQPPSQSAIISLVEEAAPVIICEVKNSFDSDGIILDKAVYSQESDFTEADAKDNLEIDSISNNVPATDSFEYISAIEPMLDLDASIVSQDGDSVTPAQPENQPECSNYVRKTADYVKQEAVLRIKYLKAKMKIELQILESKKRAAELEEENNRVLLEKSKLELVELKEKLGKN